jgi:TatD DNase family protein
MHRHRPVPQVIEMTWFDSHAHLQDDDFDSDWRAVLGRALENQVDRILLPASDLADSKKGIERALQDSHLVCSVGCHPHGAAKFSADHLRELRQLIETYRGKPVVAIGEAGLDYHYDFSPRSVQHDVFQVQLDLAFDMELPLIIHEREAVADCLGMIQNQAAKGRLRSVPGVFHCYSGSSETAAILLKLGFYIGVDGPVTFANARKLPDVIRACPLDRLVLETDSPYLAPVPYRGHRNEPSYLPIIGARVAEILSLPPAEVASQMTANTCRLFGLS